MNRAAQILTGIALVFGLASCGGSSPAAPTPPAPTVTPTRIINVTGDLSFGNVNFGSAPTKTFTISNSGNATLTYTGFTCVGGTGCAGYSATPLTGTIAAGGTQTVTLQFTPTIAQFYSNVLTVTSDKTDGNNAINVSGTGINPNPIYTKSGSGDTVFDMPTYVRRVTITGTYNGYSSNFMVKIAGSTVVNELVGTGWGQTHFSGTYLITAGGTVQITNSSGVAWTFTEVR